MSDAGPVWVTAAQRDTFDELERKSFNRDGGWVPVRKIDRQVELDNLVELGLAETRCEPSGGSQLAELSYRRIVGARFIAVLPREDDGVTAAASSFVGHPGVVADGSAS